MCAHVCALQVSDVFVQSFDAKAYAAWLRGTLDGIAHQRGQYSIQRGIAVNGSPFHRSVEGERTRLELREVDHVQPCFEAQRRERHWRSSHSSRAIRMANTQADASHTTSHMSSHPGTQQQTMSPARRHSTSASLDPSYSASPRASPLPRHSSPALPTSPRPPSLQSGLPELTATPRIQSPRPRRFDTSPGSPLVPSPRAATSSPVAFAPAAVDRFGGSFGLDESGSASAREQSTPPPLAPPPSTPRDRYFTSTAVDFAWTSRQAAGSWESDALALAMANRQSDAAGALLAQIRRPETASSGRCPSTRSTFPGSTLAALGQTYGPTDEQQRQQQLSGAAPRMVLPLASARVHTPGFQTRPTRLKAAPKILVSPRRPSAHAAVAPPPTSMPSGSVHSPRVSSPARGSMAGSGSGATSRSRVRSDSLREKESREGRNDWRVDIREGRMDWRSHGWSSLRVNISRE